MTKDPDGFYHIRAFANKNTYNEWLADPDENQALKLLDVTIPISDEQGVMNIVELTTASNQTNYVSIDGSVVLKCVLLPKHTILLLGNMQIPMKTVR